MESNLDNDYICKIKHIIYLLQVVKYFNFANIIRIPASLPLPMFRYQIFYFHNNVHKLYTVVTDHACILTRK